MTRILCGIAAPWDLPVSTCVAALMRALPVVALADLVVPLGRAQANGHTPAALRPVLKDIAHDATVARAAFNLVFADARAAEAEEVAELAKILLQRLQQRRAG